MISTTSRVDDRHAGYVTGGPLDHGWSMTIREAIELQQALAASVIREDRYGRIETVAGVDIAYGRRGGPASAAVVVYRLSGLLPIEQARATVPTSFPYVPGLLTFREAPAALAAIAALSRPPDLLLCDGQGIAHPRRIGFAAHLGLYLGLPSIGVAKSRLIGHHDEPGPLPGDWKPLIDRDEVIGVALRTRAEGRPLYISIGNRVSLETAIAFVRACGKGFRLPEPCRHADRLSKVAPL